jgi:hypothetical protein
MKTILFFVLAVFVMASCSTPKYTYKFDYHDYNAGRKEKQAMKEVAANPGPVEIQPEMLVAEAPVVVPEVSKSIDAPAATKNAPLTMTKAEKKQMVTEYKAAVKQVLKAKNLKEVKADIDQSTKVMDRDLKLSLIFLIVAIVGGVLYTVSPTLTYVITTVAFILAVVFFIKWLMKQ